jgi:hypothetical protein
METTNVVWVGRTFRGLAHNSVTFCYCSAEGVTTVVSLLYKLQFVFFVSRTKEEVIRPLSLSAYYAYQDTLLRFDN